jgi:hypothetical protein
VAAAAAAGVLYYLHTVSCVLAPAPAAREPAQARMESAQGAPLISIFCWGGHGGEPGAVCWSRARAFARPLISASCDAHLSVHLSTCTPAHRSLQTGCTAGVTMQSMAREFSRCMLATHLIALIEVRCPPPLAARRGGRAPSIGSRPLVKCTAYSLLGHYELLDLGQYIDCLSTCGEPSPASTMSGDGLRRGLQRTSWLTVGWWAVTRTQSHHTQPHEEDEGSVRDFASHSISVSTV